MIMTIHSYLKYLIKTITVIAPLVIQLLQLTHQIYQDFLYPENSIFFKLKGKLSGQQNMINQ